MTAASHLDKPTAIESMVADAISYAARRRERVLRALVALCGGMPEALDRVSVDPYGPRIALDGVEVWRGAWVPRGMSGGDDDGMVWHERYTSTCPLGVLLASQEGA